MKCNMGVIDRYIRTSIGMAFLVYAGFTLNPVLLIPIAIVGYTVSTKWCLLYQMMGINTGCHLSGEYRRGRNVIAEGLLTSLSFLLLLLIIYFIASYISLSL